MVTKKHLITLSCLFFSIALQAQLHSFTTTLGVVGYQGDMVYGYIDNKEIHPNVGVSFQTFINPERPQFLGRMSASFGRITGNDANNAAHKSRGLSFESPLTVIDATLLWQPFARQKFTEQGGVKNFHPQLNPFVGAGVGVVFTNPYVVGLRFDASDKAKPMNRTHFFVPVRFGLRYDILRNWSFGVEGSTGFAFTDYLDGVSQSGNPNNNDWFTNVGLTVTYHINPTEKKEDF